MAAFKVIQLADYVSQEGGGRKGLPKSFLNRFTRVRVELLQSKDLLFIAGKLALARMRVKPVPHSR